MRCFDFDIITRAQLEDRGKNPDAVFRGPRRPAPGVRIVLDPYDRLSDTIVTCVPSYDDAEDGSWTTAYVTGGEA